MVAGGHDFLEIALHLLPIVNVGGGQGGEADNRVHGGADIVRHVGEENALGSAGPVGLGQGVFQKGFLFHFGTGFLIYAAKPDHYAPAGCPVPDRDGLHLEIADLAAADGPVAEVIDAPVFKLLGQIVPGKDPAEQIPVIYIDAGLDIPLHRRFHGEFPGEKVIQNAEGAGVSTQGASLTAFQIEKTDQVEVCTQGLDQLLVAALLLKLFLPLLLFLGGAVQQKTLIEQFAVFHDQLYVAHHMENLSVGMTDPIFHADAVPRIFEGLDAVQQLFSVPLHYGGGNGVEAVSKELFLRLVAQDFQGPVDAEDPGPIQTVAEHAAVHRGKQGFQGLVFPAQFFLIGPLFRYVDPYAYSAHDAAVQVVQRGLVGGQQAGSLAGLDGFLRHAGLLCLHDDPLGFDAGGVVLLHVPDIGVPPALDLRFGLVHRLAKAVVDFLVDAVLRFIPDQVGDAVDSGL